MGAPEITPRHALQRAAVLGFDMLHFGRGIQVDEVFPPLGYRPGLKRNSPVRRVDDHLLSQTNAVDGPVLHPVVLGGRSIPLQGCAQRWPNEAPLPTFPERPADHPESAAESTSGPPRVPAPTTRAPREVPTVPPNRGTAFSSETPFETVARSLLSSVGCRSRGVRRREAGRAYSVRANVTVDDILPNGIVPVATSCPLPRRLALDCAVGGPGIAYLSAVERIAAHHAPNLIGDTLASAGNGDRS